MDKRVVHVDDDPSILRLVSHKLTKEGYDVISIQDPEQAMSQIFENSIRVVILDIDMAKLDGLSLLRNIKQRDGGVQVIMMTGMVSIGTVLHATRLGAEEFVFKPVVDLNEIVNAVNRSFAKINRWWKALHEWMERSDANEQAGRCLTSFTPASFIPATERLGHGMPIDSGMPMAPGMPMLQK